MERLRVGLGAPPSARRARQDGSFALLPRQTEDELLLSEVHSKLDGALQFLRSVLGDLLLDDARPAPGGGVCLGRGGAAPSRSPERLPRTEPTLAEEEVRQVVRFSSETSKYAEFPDDFVLVWRFVGLLSEAAPSAPSREGLRGEPLCRMVLQGVRLMHLCGYDYSDVVVVLAHASVYFKGVLVTLGDRMTADETAHVVMLLVFLAHCFVLDENCPLRCWQKYIFRKYCTLKVLDAATFRIFQMRDFRLRVSEQEGRQALGRLLDPRNDFQVVLKLHDSKGFNGKVLRNGAPVVPHTNGHHPALATPQTNGHRVATVDGLT